MAKGRESGMPPAELWETFFEPAAILTALGCRSLSGDCIEFGCGYGTFTVAAAAEFSGTVFALDIDPTMVETTQARVKQAGLKNVIVKQRDVAVNGCGRPDSTASFVMLFNLLHIEDPVNLLHESWRVLRLGGLAGVIHWKVDPKRLEGHRSKPDLLRSNAGLGAARLGCDGCVTKTFQGRHGIGVWCCSALDI